MRIQGCTSLCKDRKKFNLTLLWRGYLIHRSVNIHLPAATTQISVLAWLAVHVNCHYQPDSCSHGWFCFRALSMIKTKSSLQLPWKYRFRYPPGWWSIFHINQTNPKTIFLVRLRCSNRKLTRKLFHNRQTKLSGYSTSGRIKPSCYSSLLFRRLFHSALNLKVAIQRMGNGNTVLHTIPQQPQKQLLSRQVPLLKREDDERVWLMWNN